MSKRIANVEGRDSNQHPVLKRRWCYALFLATCVTLCIGLIYCSLSYDRGLTREAFGGDSGWFNGDAMYPAHLIEDVIVNGNDFEAWALPPAPFVIPDFLFAGMARCITPRPALGMFLTGAFLFLSVAFSAGFAARSISREKFVVTVAATVAAMIASVWIAWGGSATRLRFLFLPAYHTGTFALTILSIAFGVHLAVDAEKKQRVRFGLFIVIGFLAGFSDLLTIAYMSAPLTAALGIGWLLKLVSTRRFLAVSLLAFVAPLAGYIACSRMLAVHSLGTFGNTSLEVITRCGSLMIKGFLSELVAFRPIIVLSALWIIASWAATALWIRQLRRTEEGNNDKNQLTRRVLLVLSFSLAGPSIVCALIVSGNYMLINDGYHHIFRYLQPLIYAPLFFWPLLLPDSILAWIRQGCPPRVAWGLGVALLIGLGSANRVVGIGPHAIHSYVPDYVRALDDIATKRGLTQGVAYYWAARDVNMFSQRKIRVFPVIPDWRHMHWMNSRQWITGPFEAHTPKPRPEFVLVAPTGIATRDAVIRQFGEPSEEIALDANSPGRVVMIYNRPDNPRLRNLFRDPLAWWTNGFHGFESHGDKPGGGWRWCANRGEAMLHNPTEKPMTVEIEFECATARPERATMRLDGPLIQDTLSVDHSGTRFRRTVTLAPGDNPVSFSTDARPLDHPTDPRQLVFQIRDFRMEKLTGNGQNEMAAKGRK